MNFSVCKGCNNNIVWGITEDGTRIPLDPRAAVYDVEEVEGVVQATRDRTAMVTHFATCPKASDFGRGRKKKGKGNG